jgi:hypothetical protein
LYSTDSTTDDEDKRIAGVFHSPFTIHHSPLFFTFMDKILEQPQQNGVEAETQLYLLRINQLYTNIQNWLQDEPLVLENGEIEVIEALGQYQAPGLSIKTKEGEQLAEFKPTGASVLLAKGAIDVNGGVDKGFILYMLKSDPQTYFKIPTDGWYWFKDRLDVDAHFLNEKTPLLQLITWVSDYEF